ncbi:A/G-specific DNA-adenine glycosylase [Oceanithermus profundus DSM 14977]|uniref:Adenine DNA glycosylase n=1 Tax=Oceanithermus profundus (strain DSM 14977 / NBRC 100410 / VKM B-2274 / 506) TaxID=670487 RepID=E4U6N0_OCEP5|nr:A/G-specific adenine glycosylase [Oceanithermus profundus]ADR35768.1 A/G-specific DNA-adenine glycosylase [Oceanithermus profundus DSM 14977]
MTPALRRALLAWYDAERRALPWRGTRDPYRILLSEVLLQQTRVEQALPYYRRFLERFPTLEALAAADEEAVLAAWQGAGYYARARNLLRLAREVARAGWPRDRAGLLQLPGVGPYTAAAVASIAFGEPVAAVDGNVRRVLARVHAEPEPGAAWLGRAAADWLEPARPGDWNQALMELGARVCTPRNPDCAACPLAGICRGRAAPERYPAPRKRRARTEERWALVLQAPGGVVLEHRSTGQLAGLWGVPMGPGAAPPAVALARYRARAVEPAGTVRHAFSHRRLVVHVFRGRAPEGGVAPGARPLAELDRKLLRAAGLEGAAEGEA